MVMIVGHRGARALWPENSISGFRKLLALGVEAVEFDVHETRDRQLVVIHDPRLERTTERVGEIRELDAAQVLTSKLRRETGATDEEECVPSLEAVLDLLRPSGLELHIELKTNSIGEIDEGAIGRVIETVHRHGVQQQTILTCFVPEVLDQVRARWPGSRVLGSLDLRSAEMMGGIDRALARYAALDGCIVAIEKQLLAACWSRCHAALGAERLGAWVLNESVDLERWMAMPLRQITTDRPDLALAARARLERPRQSYGSPASP